MLLKMSRNFLFLIVGFFLLKSDASEKLSRQKRFLIWQRGYLNWIVIVVGVGIPFEVKRHNVALGSVVKAFYRLPENASYITTAPTGFNRKKRYVPTRWELYSALEDYIESYGLGDGKSCLLRTICEASSNPFDRKSGILAEIAHAFFVPSTTGDAAEDSDKRVYHSAERLGKATGRCDTMFHECDVNLIDLYSKLLS